MRIIPWEYIILTEWAKATWPDLKFIDAKIQVQKPSQVCDPPQSVNF
jgi:hypothetical protein